MHYAFKPNGEAAGCFNVNAATKPDRAKILLTAYLTNSIIYVDVKNNYEAVGVGIGS